MVFLEFIVSMLELGYRALIFYLPVLAANITIYMIFAKLGSCPLDLNIKIKGKRLVGPGRDFIGFFWWGFVGTFVAMWQGRALAGLYLGIGGWTGTLINSIIKRRIGIKQGQGFIPFDQIDMILGSSLFYASAYALDWKIFVSGIVIGLILHPTVNLGRTIWEKSIGQTLRK